MPRALRLQWRIALLAAMAWALGGCVGLAIPLGELKTSAPSSTGSIKASWTLPESLPPGLAESDAAAMADAARRALADGGPAVEEWQNPITGSSASFAASGAVEDRDGERCRTFLSTVTSLKGVHRYTCRACRSGSGRVTVSSIEAAEVAAVSAAGI